MRNPTHRFLEGDFFGLWMCVWSSTWVGVGFAVVAPRKNGRKNGVRNMASSIIASMRHPKTAGGAIPNAYRARHSAFCQLFCCSLRFTGDRLKTPLAPLLLHSALHASTPHHPPAPQRPFVSVMLPAPLPAVPGPAGGAAERAGRQGHQAVRPSVGIDGQGGGCRKQQEGRGASCRRGVAEGGGGPAGVPQRAPQPPAPGKMLAFSGCGGGGSRGLRGFGVRVFGGMRGASQPLSCST